MINDMAQDDQLHTHSHFTPYVPLFVPVILRISPYNHFLFSVFKIFNSKFTICFEFKKLKKLKLVSILNYETNKNQKQF